MQDSQGGLGISLHENPRVMQSLQSPNPQLSQQTLCGHCKSSYNCGIIIQRG